MSMPIYRCGWCGFPTDHKGKKLPGVNSPEEADRYLKENENCEEILVNGDCCPDGPN